MGGPGENCAEACGAMEEECIEDMLILQSAEDVESWALAAGVKCASIIDRCDIGESPIFNYSIWENENLCTFCSNPNHPGWLNGNRCEAKYQVRERLCPCTSTSMGTTDSPVESTTAESTTEPTDVDTYRFTTSEPGQNCDQACGLMEEECVEDMPLLYSAEEVASWASAVGVTCTAL